MNKENEPAYPGIKIEQIGDSAYNLPTKIYNTGLTKREYFAAMAMQGIISKFNIFQLDNKDIKYMSEKSFIVADAMIKESLK